MATNGVYGIGVPANITSNDVEIYYNYHEERSSDTTDSAAFKKLPSSVLVPSSREVEPGANVSQFENDSSLIGMYNLKLPLDKFGKRGYYSVYIKPKEIPCSIQDVGVLAAYSDVRGIIINSEEVDDASIKTLLNKDDGLVGYRIEYYDSGKRADYYRVITSNFKVEPVVQNLSNSNQKSVRYRYNSSSNLVFITVSPSSAPSFKPNALPFIGSAGQNILIINTKFNPIMLDIEMTEHDIETVSTMLEGSQLRNLENGLLTTYNSDHEIYNQFTFYALKSSATGEPIYEVRKQNESIDNSQSYDIIESNEAGD